MPCNCPKEFQQQSPFSPWTTQSEKIVEDNEKILRIVRDPTEWTDGNRTDRLFSRQDIREEERGLSISRKNHTSLDGILSINTKRVVGAFEAKCSEIRNIANPVPQPVCIIDDGSADNPSHALIVKSQSMDAAIPNKWPCLLGEIERAFGFYPGCIPKTLEDTFLR